MTREIATIPPLPDTETARQIAQEPERFELWDDAERVAEVEQRPDEVSATYLHVLAKPLPLDVALTLCERAAAFLSEWGEDDAKVMSVLTRALELDPGAQWAFRRLTMLLTIERRWDELLAEYDRVLAATEDSQRQIELLTEAAQVAKDLAGRADRAIGYLAALTKLRPNDGQIIASLERLLEREGRFRELVELQQARLGELSPSEARTLRAQIATCLLDKLDSPEEALDATAGLLDDPATRDAALDLLERAFASPSSPAEVKGRALAELRRNYAELGRTDEIVRVLTAAIRVSEEAHAQGAVAGDALDRATLHRDVAELFVSQGNEEAAVDHYSALLILQPNSDEAMTKLSELSERTGRLDRYADALAKAADALGTGGSLSPRAVTLLFEAGSVRSDILSDPAGAVALYRRIFGEGGAASPVQLDVCRRLSGLLRDDGQRAERLDVLERRASLEPGAEMRRALRLEAASIAEALGDADRALGAYGLVLAENGDDETAHAASIALLERAHRWAEMVTALRRAAEARSDQGRDLRVRAARVLEQELGNADGAIDEWIEIEDLFGTDPETIDALVALLSGSGRWLDLVSVLERGLETTQGDARRVELVQRLGDVYREHTGAPMKALACYKTVATEVPAHEGARTGLTALLDNAQCRSLAAKILLAAFDATGDWAGRLSLLEHRLDLAEDDSERTALLREAADLHEARRGDKGGALAALARALPLAPNDTQIEARMVVLASETGDFATLSQALGAAVDAGPEADRAADLQEHRGSLLEEKLGDAKAALDVYGAAFELAPERQKLAASIVRVATHEELWDTAATAIVTSARARASLDRALLATFEGAAEAASAWDAAADALSRAVEADTALSPSFASEFERRTAMWHRDRREDLAAAETSLTRALARAGDEVTTLSMLADVQRRAPGAPLVSTLLRLANMDYDSLSALREAGITSLDVLRDEEQAATIFERLLGELAERLEKDAVSLDLFAESVVTGPEEEDLADQATFAINKLVDLAKAQGDHLRAVEVLDRAARIPLGEAPAIGRLHEAAAIAEERMGDVERAVRLLQTILKQSPSDARAIESLGALFARTGKTADLLALRKHELALAIQVADNLRLRLDIARLLGELGDEEGQLGALRANLAEEPAHESSLSELARLLEAQGAFETLTSTLLNEANTLADRGEKSRAAALYTRASELAEGKLGDVPLALEARTRSADLEPTPETFDALARLATLEGDHQAAVTWVERRLSALPPEATEERIATVARLANAHLSSARPEAARSALERGLGEYPESEILREPLRALYRASGAWDRLVELLTRAGEGEKKLEHLREAADVCLKKLGARDRAIPILESLTALAPTDKSARIALADALRSTGQLGPAREILAKLLEEYGRRKPPERAEVHTQLARIAKTEGDAAEARSQLETATAMNPEHPSALRFLGALYRDSGELERAERMFGALLLIAMRNPQAADSAPDGPARSEAMIHLHGVLQRLGQTERAEEMLASAFEAAKGSDHEARRLEEALRSADDPALLLRALELRLGRDDLDDAARAAVLAEMADVLAGPLARPEEALSALLGALGHDPARASLLSRAVQTARAVGADAIGQCADTLAQLATATAAKGRTEAAAALFFALGDLCENDLRNAPRAVAAYVRAEALNSEVLAAGAEIGGPVSASWITTPQPVVIPPIRLWRAIDRTAAAAGEAAAQIRALRQIAFATDTADKDALTEDIYRLAALELSSPTDIVTGLATLDWAMSREIRHEHAANLLQRACDLMPDDAAVLAAYERVARAADDPKMLLDALSRAAMSKIATMEVLREASDLATTAKDAERVSALLERAVALGDDGTTTVAETLWAITALAELREAASDYAAAVDYLTRAAEAAERDEALRFATHAADLAANKMGDLSLAIGVYERILDRDRHDRDVWLPILDLTRRAGDAARLEQKLHEAIECAFDATLRVQFRRERAALLLDTRWEDAAAELAELLNEDEDDTQAALQLTQLYERNGRHEKLADLLDRRLSGARMRGDVAQVLAMSLQLGALVTPTSAERAIDVYRAALDTSPESQPLLTRLYALYNGEDQIHDRAEILERLLAVSSGNEAVERALTLATLRDQMADDDGTLRALRAGFDAMPGHPAVRDRLAEFYKSRETWAELAEMLAKEGTAGTDGVAIARLREAAALYRDKLDRPEDAANTLLIAAARAPEDLGLLVELSRCLAAARREPEARDRLGEALSRGTAGNVDRVTLLRLRAELSGEPDELPSAIADLEAAYRLDATVAADLIEYLERYRATPAGSSDRALWLRLFDMNLTTKNNDSARDLLGEWISKEPGDIGVLRMAAWMDGLSGRWDQTVELCDRIVGLEEGAGRIAAALLVAAACTQAGYPAEARPVLELVFRDNPTDASLRDHLRRIYEETGAHRELAELATAEAEQTVDPADRFAALRRAGALWMEGASDPEAAILPLRTAAELKPRDGDVAVMLADAYIAANHLQEAANFLDTALQAQKGRRSREVSMMQHRMATIAGAVGDRANEAGWLNAALDSDAQNSEAAARLADVATELGQFDVAIKALKAIAMMKSPKPITRAMAYVRQALIAQHQGDVRKAVLLARKAQSEDPNLEEAVSLLAELSS